MKLRRRDLLRMGGAAAAGMAVGAIGARAQGDAPAPPGMPSRKLGRTGVSVKLFSLGGQAAVEQPDNADVAVPLIERALDLGVNYIDTSARYGGEDDRWSERYVGEVMARRRQQVLLATKTHDRTRDGSLRHLELFFRRWEA